MSTVGIVYNPSVDAAGLLAVDIGAWLTARDQESWIGSIDDVTAVKERVQGLALLVVLGGDGTTLQAARLAAPLGVPVFGVNMGRVGFLSEANPAGWQEPLSKVLRGEHWLERRLMLKAEHCRGGRALGSLVALNDVVVSRGTQMRAVRFHLFVDGYHVTTYTADALITSTPTGSTAYSMAAGGPLLPPQLQNFLVLPVAPHLSFERALVLHQEAVIKIQVEMEHEAMATADGQDAIALQTGDEVVIGKHTYQSCFARVDGPNYFYHRLMQRLSYWSLKS